MTAPTRRHVITGSLAAIGAAGAPAIAIAASPDERLRNAVQELQDAMQARWPEGEIDIVVFMVHGTDQERSHDHAGPHATGARLTVHLAPARHQGGVASRAACL